MATAARDGTVHLTVVATGKTLGALRSTGEEVSSLAYSRDSKRLAFVTVGGALIVVDLATRQTLIERRVTARGTRQVMFVGDSHDLLVLDQDGEGQKFQLAPGTFNSRPTSQDLIDYASIFDVAGLTGADGAETKTGGSGATATSALDQCDQAASYRTRATTGGLPRRLPTRSCGRPKLSKPAARVSPGAAG